MKSSALKRILALCLTAVLFVGSALPIGAAEETQEAAEETAEEGAEGENAEGEPAEGEYIEGDATSEEGSVTMSDLPSNNGRFIASDFPESYMPEGFHKSSCTYEGQKIAIARMDNDATGEVVLAYLADEDGGNGDFYLCDTNTANMSDFVQIKNGENGYIIVLDPGDVIVAPAGYKRAKLEWYGGKTVTAWLLPGSSDEGADEGEKSAMSFFEPVNVYAAGAGGADGDWWNDEGGESEGGESEGGESEDAGSEEGGESEPAAEDGGEKSEDAGEKEAAPADKKGASAEDGSGIVYAPASDFFMVYAIDNTGTIGFYIYDKVQKTYQRYVSNSGGDDGMVGQYKKSATIRLYIIAGLALLCVILIFVLVNNILSNRGFDYDDGDEGDDEEDEVESLRRRVAKKSESRVAAAQAEYEQEDFYERQARRRREREAAEQAEAQAAKEAASAKEESRRARSAAAPAAVSYAEPETAAENADSLQPERKPRSLERRNSEPAIRRQERPAVRQAEAPAEAPRAAAAREQAPESARGAKRSMNRSDMRSLMDIDDGAAAGGEQSKPLVRRRPASGTARPGSGADGARVVSRQVGDRPARRPSGSAGAPRPVDPRRANKAGLDEDFDFEFLDI